MTRKHTALYLAALLMLTSAGTASAQAPASQFGFSGWPYRSTPACQATELPSETTQPTVIPTLLPEIDTEMGENGTKPTVAPTEGPVVATFAPTAAPTAFVTAKPTAMPTAMPTEKPAATRIPSMVDDYNTNSVTAQEQIALNLLNNDRNLNGLGSLKLDAALSELARIKSNDMRDNKYFAHESPTYGNVTNMLKMFGYQFNGAGENIAHHATVEKAQVAFMSSSGHRRNILSTAWTKVGIGVSFDAQGYVYVTQIFAR